MRRLYLMVAIVILGVVFVPTAPHAQWKTPWSYAGKDGPSQWANLDPAYAACNGKEQSPIDIRNSVKADLPVLRFEFKSGPLNIINNGYTAVRVDYAPGNGNVVTVSDKRYELTQFHFHHPSEEQIHGKPYDMVIHFMLKGSDGKVAGVAILVKAGEANATVGELWKYMPRMAGKDHVIPGVEIDPEGLVPRDTAYYTYAGSVTAPPCTEGVTWFVLKTPVTVSHQQIDAFAKLYPHDVRPPQPLDGRIVKESE
ncbi:MAG TPA: carbonic anhydrase family protein [Candidatus Acidoferrales bacterium]|nr:carbonic anhydrase family protein [Candidatus Acidoferrales bacterium]